MGTGAQNHLAGSSSPYLLQHAGNPVDWYPWGTEALEKARQEQKLLVISIGYSACHWCHVMEHESFENDDVAKIMNRAFVSVKVDREERPDIDHVYMNAAYAVSGRGGWPLNVIALPDERPVFAGTYFPRTDWIRILSFFEEAFKSDPGQLIRQADEIGKEMRKFKRVPGFRQEIEKDTLLLGQIFGQMEPDFDPDYGGTIGAPKFPMPGVLAFLLKYAFLTNDQGAVDHLRLSLEKMASGGLFDHAGGGFSRYSVDPWWHVPHFEKMLYDNAQLISLYSDAFRCFREPFHAAVVRKSMDFIIREMMSPEGLFYSALDADSEDEEGAFYAWSYREIEELFGEDAAQISRRLGITEEGNWEKGKNVIRLERAAEMTDPVLQEVLQTLFLHREMRMRPGTDDKILTGWNALMITACCDAWRALERPEYLQMADRAGRFYLKMISENEGRLYRNYKNGTFTIPGFLDDYAYLAFAFVSLYENTFAPEWLENAEKLALRALENFKDPDSAFFLYSAGQERQLIQSTLELTDQVMPSSNSEMARVLFRLGHILDMPHMIRTSEDMVRRMIHEILRNPAYHANWAALLTDYLVPPFEIYVVGPDFKNLLQPLLRTYLPHCIFSGGDQDVYPVTLKGKKIKEKTSIFLCREKRCLPPETEAGIILGQVQNFA